MKYEDDELHYGFVLTRVPRDNEWRHGHLVRSSLCYDCELLERTTMLFAVQKFGIGAAPRSKEFLVTLDGEGIGEDAKVMSTADWGEANGTAQQKADALRIRKTVVPLVHESPHFQGAIWFIVKHLEYETMADVEQMRRLDVPPFGAD